MTTDNRDYLNRYRAILQREHRKQLTAGIINTALASAALIGMIFSMAFQATGVGILCGFLFGYYSALFNGIRVKLCYVKDELKGIEEQLDNEQ